MKAIVYSQNLAATDPQSLYDTELPTPTPGDNDLLVAVKAVSVNPVDTKVRKLIGTHPLFIHAAE